MQFVDYLKDYRTDLGGKKNFHNGVCGTYDCIAMFSYYKVCKDVTSFEEIERIAGELITDSFKVLGKFVKPALCNSDYAAMEVLHAKLVRTTTLGRGEYCDYAICGDEEPYVKEHPEYRDELGGRWNK